MDTKTEIYIKQFYKYYYKFNTKDPAIIMKYEHSLRVMEISKKLATNNKLKKKEIEIASLIGLLHDIGRFIQWTCYKTYSDIASIDHGDLGVKILFKDQEIRNYIKDKSYDEIIYNSIKYHNKLSLPESLSKKNKKFCKLIRDADKLDILYLYGVDKSLIPEDNKELSKELIKDFYNNKLLKKSKSKSHNDAILLGLALIFDLNYKYSYQYIKKNNLIWNMYNNLENKERFYEYFIYADNYINNVLTKNIKRSKK